MKRTEEFKTRAWAEIDLDALCFNFKQIKSLMKPTTRIMAVVKANAYGHGAVMCANALLSAGADYLAVATFEEAEELRQAGIKAPVLVLGYVAPERASQVVALDVSVTVYNRMMAEALSLAAITAGKKAKIHIKLNTGMERLGFMPEQWEEIVPVCGLEGIETEGIFTHLACADEEDASSVKLQYERFMMAKENLEKAGIEIPLPHVLNSAGIFDFPEYQLAMVRPGIVLYGYYPSRFIHTERAELRPVMSLKSRVVHLHEVAAGNGISYGWTYTAEEKMQVATVPVGYADGYSRLLSNRGEMLVMGEKVPILGRICMDQCMINVSSVHTIGVGDEITLIGKEGEKTVTAEDLAKQTDTISYEILCAVGKRIPRLYYKNGEVIGVLNGFA